jgi:prolyl 4-hydroxylase
MSRENGAMALLLKDGYDTGTQVADDPIVWVFDNFVTIDECVHILDLAEGRMDDALVSRLGTNSASEQRTGQVAWIRHDETPILRGLVKRVGDLVGVHPNHAENLQIVHYAETQEYKPHYDAWDIGTPKGQEKTARGGNRAVTALMYLNEVDGGGGTAFPKLGLEVQAIPGRLVIFHNLYEGESVRHRNSLHGGLPVTAGEKWACNLWFRERTYQDGAPGTSARTGGAHPHNRAARRKAQRSSRKRNR